MRSQPVDDPEAAQGEGSRTRGTKCPSLWHRGVRSIFARTGVPRATCPCRRLQRKRGRVVSDLQVAFAPVNPRPGQGT